MFFNEHGGDNDQSEQTSETLSQTLNQSELILSLPEHIGQIPTLNLERELPSSFHLFHAAGGILRPMRLSQLDSSPPVLH